VVAEDNKEVKEEGDGKAVNDVDRKELHDTGSRGLAGRGEICGSINRGLIYAGKPLNPDPPKNVTTVPQSAALLSRGVEGAFICKLRRRE
jgi:hypothetical protein